MIMDMLYVVLFAHILELIIAILFFQDLFPTKQTKPVIALSGVVLYAIEYACFYAFESTIVNILVFLLINFVFVIICYRCTAMGAILSSLFLSVSVTASEYIVIGVLAMASGGDINAYRTDPTASFLLLVCSRTLYLLVSKVAVLSGLYFQQKNTRKAPLFLLIYPFFSLIILYSNWIISVNYSLSPEISATILVSCTAIVLSIILSFVFYGRTSQKLDELYNEQQELSRVHIDKVYYDLLDAQNEALKTITHDEKNHLSAIKSIANNPEVSAYIDSIYGEIKFHSMFGNTKNKYLDLQINKYQSICASSGIDFRCVIKTANLGFMDAPDLIQMIGNLLDNAIESARYSTEKYIDLSINRVNGFDVLNCINSCDREPLSAAGRLLSTKDGSQFHGFGIRSIKKTAAKYGGEFDWLYHAKQKEFIVRIAFFR